MRKENKFGETKQTFFLSKSKLTQWGGTNKYKTETDREYPRACTWETQKLKLRHGTIKTETETAW